jgi:hydrogenase maturation protease
MATIKRTCVVGIGNPLRSDDGAGPYICQLLQEKKIQDVHFIVTQQLDMGLAEELSKYDRVIFADASLELETFSFLPMQLEFHAQTQSFSHQINASILASLTSQLYKRNTQFYICAIGAANFEMGNLVSISARKNAQDAVALLSQWLQ